jgi:hypothetical protein
MGVTKKLITELTEATISRQEGLSWDDGPMIHEIIGYALEQAKARIEAPVVMIATNPGYDDPVLGYFTGNPHDIEAYLSIGSVDIEPLVVIDVPNGYDSHQKNIIAKRDRLQAEVDELNRRLEERDV